jgi:hypothetical protein
MRPSVCSRRWRYQRVGQVVSLTKESAPVAASGIWVRRSRYDGTRMFAGTSDRVDDYVVQHTGDDEGSLVGLCSWLYRERRLSLVGDDGTLFSTSSQHYSASTTSSSCMGRAGSKTSTRHRTPARRGALGGVPGRGGARRRKRAVNGGALSVATMNARASTAHGSVLCERPK